MKKHLPYLSLFAGVLALLLAAFPRPALGASATIVQVPTVVNGTNHISVRGFSINNSGQVAASGYGLGVRSWVWDSVSGQLRALPTLCPTCGIWDQNTTAWRIDVHGDVAGLSSIGRDYPHGFFWDAQTGSMQGFGFVTYSVNDMNNLHQLVGAMPVVQSGATNRHAYVWGPTSGVLDLGTLGGATSEAFGINDLGQIVGNAARADGRIKAFLWDQANGMRDLVALTDPTVTFDSRGLALNNAGKAAVFNYQSATAYLWDAQHGLQGPFLKAGQLVRSLKAYAINESDQVVGFCDWSASTWGECWAFYWDAVHGVIDLNSVLPPDSGWRLVEARDINDRGQIAGAGYLNGQVNGFLLNLVFNSPPVANAGPNQTVQAGALVTLSGANSTDPDGQNDIASYQWEQTSGPSVTLSDPTVVAPTFTAPEVGPDGASLVFRLTVRDKGGLSSTASCTVTVAWLNRPPVANAGSDQTVPEEQLVQLDASASTDPDDGLASYSWRQTEGLAVTLSDAGAMKPTFIAPDVGTGGTALVFELTVTDQHGLQAVDACIVNVSWVNAPPLANAGADQTVGERTPVTLDGSASSDPDDGIATYQWTQVSGPPVALSDPTIARPGLLAPDVSHGGTALVFKLQVTDQGGLKSEAQCTVTVLWVNTLPTVDAGENVTIASKDQDATTLHGTASDADADPLTFRWTEGQTPLSAWQSVGAGGAVQFNLGTLPPLAIGKHTLTLEVADGYDVARDEVFLTVENSPPNAAPTGEGTFQVNTPVTFAGQVSDYDGDWVTYGWLDDAVVLGNGAVQTGAEGTPVDLPPLTVSSLGVGTHTITLRVSDGVNDPVSKSFPVRIIDTQAPTLAPVASQTLLWPPNHQMVQVLIAANASDNSGLPVSLRAAIASNEPENGLGDGDVSPDWTVPAIDSAAGTISVQLRAERSGRGVGRQYTVTVTATDASRNASTANVKVLVAHDQKKK